MSEKNLDPGVIPYVKQTLFDKGKNYGIFLTPAVVFFVPAHTTESSTGY